MARWRLLNPHYLAVPGTEWEYEETNRDTGRRNKKRFEVPLFLHPDNPSDQTPPGSGEIIVAQGEGVGSRDVIFTGEPTPDMEPIDEAAQKISDSLREKWAHPIESLPTTGDFSQSLLTVLERQLDAAVQKAGGIPKAATTFPGVSLEDFQRLQEQVQALATRNAELEKNATARRA